MSGTTWYRSLTGSPQPRSRSYQPDWVSGRLPGVPPPGPAAVPLMPASPRGRRSRLRRGAAMRLRPGGAMPASLAGPLMPPADRALDAADAVDDRVERRAGGDPRVLLPQRSGGGVPRVGERGPARVQEALVQLPERLDRQEHLAPDLERCRVPRTGQPRGDGGDRPDVRRDVLAGAPVASGRGLNQRSVAVHEVDREPVDLQLAQIRARPPSRRAVGPAAQVLVGEDVIQAEQPLQMLDRGERVETVPCTVWRRRVRRAQVGDTAPPGPVARASWCRTRCPR